MCVGMCIDIDSYAGFDHKKLINKIDKQYNLPLAVCRSKSQEEHMSFSSPTNRYLSKQNRMRDKLTEIKTLLGYGGSEVFPKQIQS